MQSTTKPVVNFVSDHPEWVVAKQRDPNTPKQAWLIAAGIKFKRLESEAVAANQACAALQSEINDFNADLRDQKHKSTTEIDAINAALIDAKSRFAAAKVVSHAKLLLSEQANKALTACRNFDSNEPERTTQVKRQSLSAIRAAIEKIDAETVSVTNSQRPVAELENDLRSYLSSMAAPRTELVNLCAGVISSSTPLNLLTGHPNSLAQRGFGLAVAALGIESVIREAMERAKALDTGCLRMTAEDRAERLAELAHARYVAELDEETALDGATRRAGINAAAVLHIPADVAEQAGLITGSK